MTGRPVAEGEPGELVFTTLTKEAMPVVRYRTRDLDAADAGSVTPMRRMAKITGRSDDMLIVRGVNLFPSQVEEQILRDPALSGHYVIELAHGRLDDLLVRVEARAVQEGEAAARSAAALTQRLEGHVRPDGRGGNCGAGRDRTVDGQGAPRHRQAAEGLEAPSPTGCGP